MSTAEPGTSPTPKQQAATLRRLFRALIFRGRRKGQKTISNPRNQFALALVLFGLLGFISLSFLPFGDFAFAASLHAMTFVMVGMNLATSGGSLFFNPEEADVLCHRPIDSKALLAAKLRVIVEFSLGLAVALNLIGLFEGVSRDRNWLFLPAHLASLTLSVVFCASAVILLYNLCLRWFGKERLDGIMTMAQVIFSIGIMAGSQIIPRMVVHMNPASFNRPPAWFWLLPPAWFAAFDVVASGRSTAAGMIGLAVGGLAATALIAWLGVGLLAGAYQQGITLLNEANSSPGRGKGRERFGSRLARLPILRLWLRDPVERVTFQLVIAGLTRARDVKLRVYPVLGQFLFYPVIMLVSGFNSEHIPALMTFQIAFAGSYISFIPLLAIEQLRPSENWVASEIFQQAPLSRTDTIFHGTRKALICLVCVPGLTLLCTAMALWLGPHRELFLLLPGLLLLPIFSRFPGLSRPFLPFSEPPQTGRATGCLFAIVFFAGSAVVSALSWWAWSGGWFTWLVVEEIPLALVLIHSLDRMIRNQQLEISD